MPPERGWLAWRIAALVLGIVLIGCPLLAPLIELVMQPDAWAVWSEGGRLFRLLLNTVVVITGSVLVALVLGGSAALLLVRTDVPGRRAWMTMLGLGLFIPLPLLTCGWYLLAQFADLPLAPLWPPWARFLGAAWLHGVLGVPWVALIISVGLLWVEPELEETARLEGTEGQVLRHVIWPRCRPFVGLAALVVAWTTWHEIVVTDFFKVNTLAEEVYLQLNSGSADEAPRATATALPWCILFGWLVLWALRLWRSSCPPRWPSMQGRRRLALGRLRLPALAVLFLIAACVLFVPLYGLIAKAGTVYAVGQQSSWSLVALGNALAVKAVEAWRMLLQSVWIGLLTGLITAGTVLLLIWLTRQSPRGEALVWGTFAVLWTVPGPVLGLGLLTVIQVLIQLPGGAFWSAWLYSSPSPMPNVWSCWLRFLPLAWAAAWPVARLIPRAWDELARLDGASPWRRLWVIYWPPLARPLVGLTIAVGVLSLGEISASKLITTPGYTPLSHHIFQQLHSGLDTEVAALALLLMLSVLVISLLVGYALRGIPIHGARATAPNPARPSPAAPDR